MSKTEVKNQLVLPKHSNGGARLVEDDARQIVIVGANGSGKSRFMRALAKQYGINAFVLSAREAIYVAGTQDDGDRIDRMYSVAVEAFAGVYTGAPTTRFERLLAVLMHDEMISMLRYKEQRSLQGNADEIKLPVTHLDEVLRIWRELFPDNPMFLQDGHILFGGKGDGGDVYAPVKLSAGEKTVLYYLAAIGYAPKGSLIMVDSPEIFLHPSITQAVWNHVEQLRPDCRWVYTTHSLDFVSTRSAASMIWVRSYDARGRCWDYEVLAPSATLPDEVYMAIVGSRKPVLFIEGDVRRSIDVKLYPLVFSDFTVRPLGSCNNVIEATRSFSSLNALHGLDSYGIVDRDRRDDGEVRYLRSKRIMVPDVAEVENLLLIDDVVRAVAKACGKNPDRVSEHVRRSVIRQFASDMQSQALMHTRHRVKRVMETRVDGRFDSVDKLELHLRELVNELNPTGLYKGFLRDFKRYVDECDYASILKVYNQKSVLAGCNVAGLCGLNSKDEYLACILELLRGHTQQGRDIRRSMRKCFHYE